MIFLVTFDFIYMHLFFHKRHGLPVHQVLRSQRPRSQELSRVCRTYSNELIPIMCQLFLPHGQHPRQNIRPGREQKQLRQRIFPSQKHPPTCPMDGARIAALRNFHNRERRVVFRRSSVGNIQLWHQAVFQLRQSRSHRLDMYAPAPSKAWILPSPRLRCHARLLARLPFTQT